LAALLRQIGAIGSMIDRTKALPRHTSDRCALCCRRRCGSAWVCRSAGFQAPGDGPV